jgi:hypothetical protein
MNPPPTLNLPPNSRFPVNEPLVPIGALKVIVLLLAEII